MTHTAPRLKFTASDAFLKELRKRVDAYFERTGRPRRDCAQMYFKTASILAWFMASRFMTCPRVWQARPPGCR